MVLRGESRPAVIPEEQMERFRFMLDYSPEAVEICSTPLAAGDALSLIHIFSQPLSCFCSGYENRTRIPCVRGMYPNR